MVYRSLDFGGLVLPLSGDLRLSSMTQVNGLDSPRNTVGSAVSSSRLFVPRGVDMEEGVLTGPPRVTGVPI